MGLEGPSSSCGRPDDAAEDSLRLDLVTIENRGTGIPAAPYLRASAVLHSSCHLMDPQEGTWEQATSVPGPAEQPEQGGVTRG